MISARSVRASLLALAVLSLTTVAPAGAADPAATCQKTLAKSVSLCVKLRTKTEDKCYQKTGAACADADEKVAKIAAKVDKLLAKGCPAEGITAAGFGANLTTESLTARTVDICAGEARALISRSYGGPHGAGLASTGNSNRKCLLSALKGASKQT